LALLATALGVLLSARLGAPGTFWTIDDAGKFLALENLRADPASPWIAYPGESVDPGYRFFPQPLSGSERYGALRDGHVVSQYLSPFVWLALPGFAASGVAGLALWPALGAGAAVACTGALGTALGGTHAGRIAAALLLVAAPLPFYSAVFWEHTLAVALAAGAFVALAGDRPAGMGAGLLLAGAIFLREELTLLLAAVVAALAARRELAAAVRTTLAGVAGIGARAAFHFLSSGTWTGVHADVNRPDPFRHAAVAFEGLLAGPGLSGVPSLAPVAVLGVLVAGRLAPPRARAALVASAAVALAAISGLAWRAYPGGEDAALALLRSNSALVFLPWALLAPFLPLPRSGALRRLGGAALLFVLLFLILVPERSITGVHPGPRMLLPVLPLAAASAAVAARRDRATAVLLIPLALLSAAWSVRSLHVLHAKRALSARTAAALLAEPERTVVTDLFWLPTDQAALWKEKRFHLVGSDAGFRRLTAAAATQGETALLVVATPGRVAGAPLARIEDPALPAFSVSIHRVDLAGPDGAQAARGTSR
jgi:hypothetical protein